MPKYHVTYSIDDHRFGYVVDGILAEPEDRCLLLEDDDLTRDCAWAAEGYTVARPWGMNFLQQLKGLVETQILEATEAICHRKFAGELEQYHTMVNDDEHLAVLEWLKKIPQAADRYFPLAKIYEGIGNVMKIPVTSYNMPAQCYSCSLRIVRPGRDDNNPLHRDVWLDRLRNGINIYVPIAGSNALSSLSLIPRSHYWKEYEIRRTAGGSVIADAQYSVPCAVESDYGLHMIRPELNDSDILLFSPYLIHGGARNTNADITRILLEMRFWRKP